MIKRLLISLACMFAVTAVSAQTLDSIYFNLYTDSLKKDTYNYINLEGHYSDGRYLPLGEKEVRFSSTGGRFTGNSLFIDSSFKGEKVTVKAVVNNNPSMNREIVIYIKKIENTERLPTMEEIMNRPSPAEPSQGKQRKTRRKA